MLSVERIKTKKDKFVLCVKVERKGYRPYITFDKDLICSLLGIDYKKYWEMTHDESFTMVCYFQDRKE